jgi:hypothetical protein
MRTRARMVIEVMIIIAFCKVPRILQNFVSIIASTGQTLPSQSLYSRKYIK